MSDKQTTTGRVVVVDDDDDVRHLLATMLGAAGHAVTACADGEALRSAVDGDADAGLDVVLLDLMMPRDNGLTLLAWLLQQRPTLPVIMLTASPDAQSAIDALKGGAYDYLLKPIRREPLLLAVRNAVEKSQLRRELQARAALEPTLPQGMVANSAVMRRIVQTSTTIAPSAVPVLITGESGSGKEVVARHVHQASGRRGAFIAVNCAALPADLIDAELFGHDKGAFTGADRRRRGRFEEAEGGTLFLDELAELPLALQPKLLRVLQEREVVRLGGERVKIDVRVVAATNADLEDAVRQGRFRADLLYRLDVIRLRLPSLRERREDIVALTSTLLDRFCAEERRAVPKLTDGARRRLLGWRWPGNVRELDNVVRRSVLLLDPQASVLEAADILVDDGIQMEPETIVASLPRTTTDKIAALGAPPSEWQRLAAQPDSGPDDEPQRPFTEAKDAAVVAFERTYLVQLLKACGGNLTEAGRRAGIDRSNLRRLLVRNGLRPEDFREERFPTT